MASNSRGCASARTINCGSLRRWPRQGWTASRRACRSSRARTRPPSRRSSRKALGRRSLPSPGAWSPTSSAPWTAALMGSWWRSPVANTSSATPIAGPSRRRWSCPSRPPASPTRTVSTRSFSLLMLRGRALTGSSRRSSAWRGKAIWTRWRWWTRSAGCRRARWASWFARSRSASASPSRPTSTTTSAARRLTPSWPWPPGARSHT